MTARNKIRISTSDTADAVNVACSEVGQAVGLSVQPEFQEIEGACLILELRLGAEAVDPVPPSLLAADLDKASSHVEVLSAWNEDVTVGPSPRFSPHVLGQRFDDLPPVAERALRDNLATAQWDRGDTAWHLAVPSVCARQQIVGLSHRNGYTRRFTSLDVAAIQRGLAS
jgi:hypothetical protein